MLMHKGEGLNLRDLEIDSFFFVSGHAVIIDISCSLSIQIIRGFMVGCYRSRD